MSEDMQDQDGQRLSGAALAKLFGVTYRALRHYSDKGLLSASAVRGAPIKFTSNARERLQFIAKMRWVGLSLHEIEKALQTAGRSGASDTCARPQMHFASALPSLMHKDMSFNRHF